MRPIRYVWNEFIYKIKYRWNPAKWVPATILCIRFPFLYPRNRFSGKHYTNWTLSNLQRKAHSKAYELKGEFGNKENPAHIEKVSDWWAFVERFYSFLESCVGFFHIIPAYTELGAMPEGWRKAFGIYICKDLKRALLADGGRKRLKKYGIDQIKEKYGCYDEETEVLTKSGWKYFRDVNYEDEIATLNSSDELEYQQPTNIINSPYKGDMYVLKNRGLDIKVTPNHNLYVAKGSYYNGSKNNEKREYVFELCHPDKYFGKDKRFKKGCNWVGEKPNNFFTVPDYSYTNTAKSKKGKIYKRTYTIPGKTYETIPFLRFLGFYVAEGYTRHNKMGSNICLAYNKYDEEGLVNELCRGIGVDVLRQKNTGIKKFGCAPLAVWLKENCGHLAPNKKVPDFIKNLEPQYIEEFLKYLYIGDGHKTDTSNILTTISKRLADDVCELLLKAGYSFRVSYRKSRNNGDNKIVSKHPTYEISWLKNTYIEIDNSKAKGIPSFEEKWEHYDGNIYCVTVPNHIIYVRRGGKGYWCGNSLCWYDHGGNEETNKIIAKYGYISEHTCIECGKSADYVTKGWIEPYCKEHLPEWVDLNDEEQVNTYYTEDFRFYGQYRIKFKEKEETKDGEQQ